MSHQVTEHFTVEEFACHDGAIYPLEWIAPRLLPLCETLEVVRDAADGDPVHIDSGYRTPAYNERIGGAAHSQHMAGRAADIKHPKLSPAAMFNLVLRLYKDGMLPNLGGVGLYPTFVHLDVRPRIGGHLAIWGGDRPSNIA